MIATYPSIRLNRLRSTVMVVKRNGLSCARLNSRPISNAVYANATKTLAAMMPKPKCGPAMKIASGVRHATTIAVRP